MDFGFAFNTMTLIDPSDSQQYMDMGTTLHLANSAGNMKSFFNYDTGKYVTTANGSCIPIHSSGSFSFPSLSQPLKLNIIFVTPSIIKKPCINASFH